MLGEHIDCRRVVGAVTRVQSLHLGHQVEEEAPHSLLALWKPEEKTRLNNVQHFRRLRNIVCRRFLFSLQPCCNTEGPTLDVPALTEKQCCSWGILGWNLLGTLFQRLDQHLLEGADFLQVSQNQRNVRAAEPETTCSTEALP